MLPLADPHGLRLTLTESESSLGRIFTPWERSPIPVEHQIRGLEAREWWSKIWRQRSLFCTEASGFGSSARRRLDALRPGEGTSGQYVDLRALPTARRGAWGTGSVHHLAWRMEDDTHELEVREQVVRSMAHSRRR